MEVLIPLAIMAIVIALLGIFGWISHKQEKERTAKIGQLAASMGLEFRPQGDLELSQRLGILQLFKLGHSRKLMNLLTGETDECRISIFDYRYTTGSGKSTHTTKLTLAALESKRLRIPAFTLRPENFFDKIGGLLGLQDIDFADNLEFSKTFVLKSAEEEKTRELFNRSLQDFFIEREGCCVEAFPGIMVYYIPGSRRKPEEFPGLLEEAYQVFGVIVDR
ncbi:MAG: hypothetical protein ACKO0N_12855 [Planctomycetota bacterium]